MLTIGLHGVPGRDADGTSHDHGVAVMENGRVVYCQELERHTGRKHDGALDAHFEDLVGSLLRPGEPVQIVLVNSFTGCDFRSARGMLEITGSGDLEVPEILAECRGRLKIQGTPHPARFYTICHEMAHVATGLPFFGPFPSNSLLIHVDGGASRSCASAWYWDGRQVTCLDHGWHAGLKGAANNFNDSPLSRWILGLDAKDHLSMPGKLMGLASFGRPDLATTEWLTRHAWMRDGSLFRDEACAALQRGLPGLPLVAFSPRDRGSQVLAACMQRHFEEEVLAYIRTHRASTGARHLYYSGGAALNIHANVRIEQELGFESVSIPPAPSDAGLALGAAAFLEWRAGHDVRPHSPFLNTVPIESPAIAAAGVPILRTPDEAAKAIADGKIIGVWAGDAEVGPRALGHRSLLARPDSVSLRRRLSEDMKQREWYRPVAPMLLPEVAREALVGYVDGSALGRFMLGAWPLAPGWLAPFEGCVHADGTVRAQIVDEHAPQLDHIHQVLRTLRHRYGVQGVINTSFNTRGMPIVHRISEAVRVARELGLDALWLVT